ncbi:MAG: universal stress protein [Campylobacter sp.]|nr:universal stress protein [Campylobacter sp.]
MSKIIICVDKNPLNRSVIDHGLSIAKNLSKDVVFLRVIKTPLFTPNFMGLAAGGLVVGSEMACDLEELKPTKDQIDESEKILSAALKQAENSGVKTTTDLESGDLIDILINYEDAFLIVSAVKDESEEIENNIIALVRETKIPILFVKSEFKAPKSVMVAYDGSENANKALNTLKNSKIFGENLEYHIANVNDNTEKASKILADAKEILNGENATFVILSGNAADEIIKYRREHELDIYVLGSYSKGIFRTLLFGSTSKDIVQNSLVSVFVVS